MRNDWRLDVKALVIGVMLNIAAFALIAISLYTVVSNGGFPPGFFS